MGLVLLGKLLQEKNTVSLPHFCTPSNTNHRGSHTLDSLQLIISLKKNDRDLSVSCLYVIILPNSFHMLCSWG